MGLNNQKGFSFLEVMFSMGLIMIIATANAKNFLGQVKQQNFLEFKVKKEILQNAMMGQFLAVPQNCGCMFETAFSFPRNGIDQLRTRGPIQEINIYRKAQTNPCAANRRIYTLASSQSNQDAVLKDVAIQNIRRVSEENYSGKLRVVVKSAKPQSGPGIAGFEIPISIEAKKRNNGTYKLVSCSLQSVSQTSTEEDKEFDPLFKVQWQTVNLYSEGGRGRSRDDFNMRLDSLPGGYPCGPVSEVAVKNDNVDNDTKGVTLSTFSDYDGKESGYFRFFDTKNRFIAAIGQASRGGDGTDRGSSGTINLPLTKKKFRVQSCGDGRNLYPLHFAVQRIIE